MLKEVQKSHYKRKPGNWKKFLWILLFLLFIAAFFFIGCHTRKIDVKGCSYYTKEQIIKTLVKNRMDENSILLYLKNKYMKKPQIPFVQDIDVELKGPSHIQITVYEKVMTGCIEYMDEIMYFDKDGEIVESSKKKIQDVPYVSGLKFDNLVLHKKIQIDNEELFAQILNITQLIRKYELKIDRISFDSEYNITLVTGKIKILLGKHAVYDEQIANLANIMPKLTAKYSSGELDMTKFVTGEELFPFREDNKSKTVK